MFEWKVKQDLSIVPKIMFLKRFWSHSIYGIEPRSFERTIALAFSSFNITSLFSYCFLKFLCRSAFHTEKQEFDDVAARFDFRTCTILHLFNCSNSFNNIGAEFKFYALKNESWFNCQIIPSQKHSTMSKNSSFTMFQYQN